MPVFVNQFNGPNWPSDPISFENLVVDENTRINVNSFNGNEGRHNTNSDPISFENMQVKPNSQINHNSFNGNVGQHNAISVSFANVTVGENSVISSNSNNGNVGPHVTNSGAAWSNSSWSSNNGNGSSACYAGGYQHQPAGGPTSTSTSFTVAEIAYLERLLVEVGGHHAAQGRGNDSARKTPVSQRDLPSGRIEDVDDGTIEDGQPDGNGNDKESVHSNGVRVVQFERRDTGSAEQSTQDRFDGQSNLTGEMSEGSVELTAYSERTSGDTVHIDRDDMSINGRMVLEEMSEEIIDLGNDYDGIEEQSIRGEWSDTQSITLGPEVRAGRALAPKKRASLGARVLRTLLTVAGLRTKGSSQENIVM